MHRTVQLRLASFPNAGESGQQESSGAFHEHRVLETVIAPSRCAECHDIEVHNHGVTTRVAHADESLAQQADSPIQVVAMWVSIETTT